MKKVLYLMLVCFSFLFFGCTPNTVSNNEVVRIHIRANSNNEEDQNVKLKVRDNVIKFITPLIAECNNSCDVKNVLSDNLNGIEKVANKVLEECGFKYYSNAKINNEYFPSREYGGKVFPADYYDALILELGSGAGDNWWCVAYPPLCFVGYESGNNIVYKSKIVELINKYFGE